MPVTRSLDVFFDLHLNKRLSKQSWGWWFETPSCSWWRHCNDRNITPGFRPRVVLRCYVWINPRKRFSKQGVTNITRKGNRHLGLERHAPIASLTCSVFSSLQERSRELQLMSRKTKIDAYFHERNIFSLLCPMCQTMAHWELSIETEMAFESPAKVFISWIHVDYVIVSLKMVCSYEKMSHQHKLM